MTGRRGSRPGRVATVLQKATGGSEVPDIDGRITAMHRRDVKVAWAFVVGLWLAIIFVLWGTWAIAPDSGARSILIVGAAILLLFNTAAIMAMLRHYREDRDFMYGLDLKHLDAARGQAGRS
jgi:hypothetical protein